MPQPPLLFRGCCKTHVEASVGAVIEGVNELSGEHIPLLEKEGWMRGQKYREATLVRADGVVSPARSLGLNAFAGLTTILCFALSRSRFAPVCGNSVASRYLIYAASSPPFQGGECRLIPIHSHLHRAPLQKVRS